jgi:hypothetical protein
MLGTLCTYHLIQNSTRLLAAFFIIKKVSISHSLSIPMTLKTIMLMMMMVRVVFGREKKSHFVCSLEFISRLLRIRKLNEHECLIMRSDSIDI